MEDDIRKITLTASPTVYSGAGSTILMTVPKKIVDALRIRAGSMIEVSIRNTGIVVEKRKPKLKDEKTDEEGREENPGDPEPEQTPNL